MNHSDWVKVMGKQEAAMLHIAMKGRNPIVISMAFFLKIGVGLVATI